LNTSYLSNFFKKEIKNFDFDKSFSFSYYIFPYKKIPYGELILKFSIKNKLDPHLLTCLIFEESGFDEGAVSYKGAVGLMQYKVINENYWDKHKDPSFSIEVGSLHLRALFDELNGDLLKTIAAYNCGINCVKERKRPPKETIVFIEKVLDCYYEVWLRTPDISFPFNFCKK